MNDEQIKLLQRIAADVASIKAALAASVGASAAALGVQASASGGVSKIGPAPDEDLDSDYGDPVFKYPLKEKYEAREHGEYVGLRYSELPSWLLDSIAKYLVKVAYASRKNGGEANEKKAWYAEKDAARAMGWSLRNKGKDMSRSAQAAEEDYESGGFGDGTEDIPFIVNMSLAREWWRP